jgi:membrane protein DedA with SNARE-associated domain
LLAILNDAVTTVLTDHGYTAIFVLMVLESACIPIPSEVTMLFGGALTTAAVVGAGNELSVPMVVLAGVLGNLVGSWLAYWAGLRGGRPLIDRFGRYLLIRPHEVDRAHAWFERRGDITVFVSRMLPVVRTFISLPAGVAAMPLKRFTIYTVLGCLPWCIALTLIGAALGSQWHEAEVVIQRFAWAIGGVLGIAIIVFVARRWRTVREEYAALDAEAARSRAGADEA